MDNRKLVSAETLKLIEQVMNDYAFVLADVRKDIPKMLITYCTMRPVRISFEGISPYAL